MPVAAHRALAAQRKELNKLVAAYARQKGLPHANVHMDLRRACGGPDLAAATSEQVLERMEQDPALARRPSLTVHDPTPASRLWADVGLGSACASGASRAPCTGLLRSSADSEGRHEHRHRHPDLLGPPTTRRQLLTMAAVGGAGLAAARRRPGRAGRAPAPGTNGEVVRLTVLGTTDLHGNVYNWDYFKNAEYDDTKRTTTSASPRPPR